MATKVKDANGSEFTLKKADFNFVQNHTKIFDQVLDTKPTTFIKDAFRRFCKNKSSVVGAIIIGIIILLAILVPAISPYNINSPHPSETLLTPKLFESGTGFWDGTKTVKDIAYDTETNLPVGFDNPNAISNLETYEKDGVIYATFTYDKYEDKYGERVREIPKTYLNSYIESGYCTFDFVNIDSFEILDDKCPVRSISSINESGRIIAVVSEYRYLGYDKMPKYLFGTDNLGRDIVKRSFMGLRYSLVFATCITTVCFLFGLVWGSCSGYFGGNVDLFMERFMDILGGIPLIVIVTLFRLHLGDRLWVFALALCITGWMGTASRTRTQFYRFKGREYILASRTLGASDTRLIFRHILPNALGTIVTSSVLMIPSLIFTESTLSYLGLGLNGSNSFGNILSDNQAYLQTYPALIVFPSVIISLLMISFNLFANGLRDALNPSLKGSD